MLPVATLGFGTALYSSARVNVWLVTVFVSGLVIAASCYANPSLLRRFATASFTRQTLVGVATGLVLSCSTWWLYPTLVQIVPEAESQLARLYGRLSVPPAAPWSLLPLFVVVVAEELAFREVLLVAMVKRHGRWLGSLLALVPYALAQLGSGEWIMIPVSLLLGATWTLQRLASSGLWLPIATHFTWSALVLELYPVAGG